MHIKSFFLEEIPGDTNILTTTFLAIKSNIDRMTKLKAFYLIEKHRNVLKNCVVQVASLAFAQSVPSIIAISDILGFRIRSTYVEFAY